MCLWHITIYNRADTTDTTSARVIYRCTEPPLPTLIGEASNENEFSAYPNPTSSVLNFNSKVTGRLYNILGSEILQFNNQSKIDISQLDMTSLLQLLIKHDINIKGLSIENEPWGEVDHPSDILLYSKGSNKHG